jgi:hypothetical protein
MMEAVAVAAAAAASQRFLSMVSSSSRYRSGCQGTVIVFVGERSGAYVQDRTGHGWTALGGAWHFGAEMAATR